MLEVQKYLEEKTLEDLNEELGIKATVNEKYGLVVLNYDQINSPKLHPITLECRSLVLEMDSWELVSQSFDRFFNLGETGCPHIDWGNVTAHEKVDGSLITIFSYNNRWLYRTRSMIMPTQPINGEIGSLTWKDAIEESTEHWRLPTDGIWKDLNFIGELTCKDNRIVTKYDDKPAFYLHAVRDLGTGRFIPRKETEQYIEQAMPHWKLPKVFTFDSMSAIVEASEVLRDLQEGYVVYCNKHNLPIAKVKNPAYLAAHHMRGENGLTERRVLDLLIMCEEDEYLAVFPEDRYKIEPYLDAFSKLLLDLEDWELRIKKGEWETQKDFALAVKELPISGILFRMKQGKSLTEAFDGLTRQARYNSIMEYFE